MADKYADIPEMARYSQHCLTTMAQYSGLDPYVTTMMASHQPILDKLNAQLAQKQASTSSYVTSHTDQRDLSKVAYGKLDSLLADLKSAQKKGIKFDLTAFFPNGRLQDAGDSIADRQAALNRCITALELYPQVPDSAGWTTTLTELRGEFDKIVTTTSSADGSKSSDDKAFQALRRQWKRSYLALKRGMESVLLVNDKEKALKSIFLDLQK